MLPAFISESVKKSGYIASGKNVLPFFFALRTDLESSPNRFNGVAQEHIDLVLKENIDASVYWNPKYLGTRGFKIDDIDSHKLFNSVSFFLSLLACTSRPIVTDRLHVVIAGCLLGKKVIALDNSYGKISSVYSFSLKHRPSFDVSMRESLADVIN